jgi:hypothetical protein
MRRLTRHQLTLLSALLLPGACAAALCLTAVLAGNFYWSASAGSPAGEHVLFGRVLPGPLGWFLWIAIKPALLVALVGAAWSLYRFVKTWRTGPRPGLCPQCGYDLRASPERCPECGAISGSA